MISKLESAGLKFVEIEKLNYNSLIKDCKFVLSGSFVNFSRNELKRIIILNGGKVSSSISKTTDFLLAGKNMGPTKKIKAKDLKIKIISEIEFQKMLSS